MMNEQVSTNEMYIRTLILCGRLNKNSVSDEVLKILYDTNLVVTELLGIYINNEYVNNLGTILRNIACLVEFLNKNRNIKDKQIIINEITKILMAYTKHLKHYDLLVTLRVIVDKLEKCGIDKLEDMLDGYKTIKVHNKRYFKNKDDEYIVVNEGNICKLLVNGVCSIEDFKIMVFENNEVYFEDRKTYDLKVIPQEKVEE